MQLDNTTPFAAGYTLGIEPSGREHLVVAVKGTFTIPERDGDTARLAPAQAPLVMADEFWGEPGFSATRYEVDFALRKPRCDVLLNGSAHAPDGQPAEKVRVGLQIGSVRKVFEVVGNRRWTGTSAGPRPDRPEPFVTLPITYDRAFGGIDDIDPDETRRGAYMPNPVGAGFHESRHGLDIVGRSLPNTQETGDPVEVPWGNYRPMSFGAISRHFAARIAFAGTYDQGWQDNTFPFLPADFDLRYYQAAPEDQQIEHPEGGEEMQLLNLTPTGRARFRLPTLDVPIMVFKEGGEEENLKGTLDTIIMEPDFGRLMLVWRASVPLKRSMFEIEEVIVGRMSRAWYRARRLGKSFMPNLAAMVRTRGGRDLDEL